MIRARVRLIKLATVGFTLVLIFVGLATAFVKAHHPDLSIIGIILGSFGYTYGSLLGVFMVALFTRTRGSETGNPIAMAAGVLAVAILSNLPNDLWQMIAGCALYENPAWLPVIEFPWRIHGRHAGDRRHRLVLQDSGRPERRHPGWDEGITDGHGFAHRQALFQALPLRRRRDCKLGDDSVTTRLIVFQSHASIGQISG